MRSHGSLTEINRYMTSAGMRCNKSHRLTNYGKLLADSAPLEIVCTCTARNGPMTSHHVCAIGPHRVCDAENVRSLVWLPCATAGLCVSASESTGVCQSRTRENILDCSIYLPNETTNETSSANEPVKCNTLLQQVIYGEWKWSSGRSSNWSSRERFLWTNYEYDVF